MVFSLSNLDKKFLSLRTAGQQRSSGQMNNAGAETTLRNKRNEEDISTLEPKGFSGYVNSMGDDINFNAPEIGFLNLYDSFSRSAVLNAPDHDLKA